MMGPRLGTSATRDIPSPKGTRRIRASSAGVPGEIGTRAPPPSAEVLTASLGSGMEKGSTGWGRTDCRGDSGRSLGIQDPSCCVALCRGRWISARWDSTSAWWILSRTMLACFKLATSASSRGTFLIWCPSTSHALVTSESF